MRLPLPCYGRSKETIKFWALGSVDDFWIHAECARICVVLDRVIQKSKGLPPPSSPPPPPPVCHHFAKRLPLGRRGGNIHTAYMRKEVVHSGRRKKFEKPKGHHVYTRREGNKTMD